MTKKIFWVALVALAFSLGGCGSQPSVTVGSKIDTEGALLGNLIFLTLKNAGIPVVDKIQTGVTNVVRSAITNGEIDIYPEYTGNAYYFYSGQTEEALWKNRTAAYEMAKSLDYEAIKVVWLTPAPANNTWAIALRRDLADANNLRTLEDMAAYINAGGAFKIAGSDEFFSSEPAMPTFEAEYGFKLREDQILSFSGGNTALTTKAAASGEEGVNAAMAYGTDGQLSALDLVVMEDTHSVQPVYEPAPIIREEKLKTYPQIEPLLNEVFTRLDLLTLQTLNAQIAVEGKDAKAVAENWLKQQGLLP